MSLKNIRSVVYAVLAVPFFAVAAQAAVFSVQFGGSDGPGDGSGGRQLLATDIAGLVPAQNWNVVGTQNQTAAVGGLPGVPVFISTPPNNVTPVPLTYFSGYNQFGGQDLIAARNGDGSASGVLASVQGFNRAIQIGSSTGNNGTNSAAVIPNQKLMSHAIGVTSRQNDPANTIFGQLNLSNLNASGYTSYDLIVYLTLDAATPQGAAGHQATVILNGGAPISTQINGGYSYTVPVPFLDAAASTTIAGDYVRFNGLTGDTATFAFGSPQFFNAGGIAGFQLVQAVPEPTTMTVVLGAAGAFAMLRRRQA